MVSFNSCATDVRQGTFVSYKMRYIANAMNMRRIEAKLRTLRANRDALERKKTEMTRVLDEELNYVNRQIQNFERIYTQTQKLMKSIDEQMVLADELMNEERRNRRPRNRFRGQNEPKKDGGLVLCLFQSDSVRCNQSFSLQRKFLILSLLIKILL